MDAIPVARATRTSYENFATVCPWCRKENIFSRASDLGTFKPILGRDVSCLSPDCGKPFRIIGDVVSSAHEMLVFDCHELLDGKHYMNCILSLAQAYEVFFGLYFRVELLFRPHGRESRHRLDELNRLSRSLRKATERQGFADMRSHFLQHVVSGRTPRDLDEAATMVAELQAKRGDPSDSAISALGDVKLVPLLRSVKSTDINDVRNRIVHKQAYRPSLEEALHYLQQTRAILFPLTRVLDLRDDINRYAKHRLQEQ